MNKIRVIDLLNKIANGEEVPKKFKYNDFTFTLKDGFYLDEDGDYLLASVNYNFTNLNDEVEIIEEIIEAKEIKKLNLDTDKLRGKETVRAIDYLLEGKINELIDVINDMRDKEC